MLKLALPLIGMGLLEISMQFVDTVMAGNLSTTDLAAVAVGSSILLPVIMFGRGILMALSPIVAQHYGAEDDRSLLIARNVRQALWLCVIIAIPGIFILRNIEPLLFFMDIDPKVTVLTTAYLKAASWGVLGFLGFFTLKHFHEAISITLPAMYVGIVGLFFNITGNYILMYGKLGFPALGAIGTGYATAILQWAMFICLFGYTFFKSMFQPYRIFSTIKLPKWKYFHELLRIGLPIGISISMEFTMFTVVALLMGGLGTIAVAAHQIALNVSAITFMVAFGFSSAITVRVGQKYGRKGIKNARFAGYVGVVLATMFMFVCAIIMFSLPELITSIYTDDMEVFGMAVTMLLAAAVYQISDGLQVSGAAALRGLKDTRIPMYITILSYWLIGLSTAYLLGYHTSLGPIGLWIGLIVGLTVAGILHNLRFYYITSKMNLKN